MQIAAKHTFDTAIVSCAGQEVSSSGFEMDAQKVVGLSRIWFGIGAPEREYHIKELDAIVLDAALAFEMTVRWNDWTIRPTPPRCVMTGNGEEYWIPSIWVSSRHDFSTFVWSNFACIESVCRYIREKEVVAAELAMACDWEDEAHFQPVLKGISTFD
jgi:hypothetical protein